jgi:WD repeat-containing protein 23
MGNISPSSGFDKPHRSLLSENFLPNTITRVASYGHKAFCGTYSKDGNIFLSAAQGNQSFVKNDNLFKVK